MRRVLQSDSDSDDDTEEYGLSDTTAHQIQPTSSHTPTPECMEQARKQNDSSIVQSSERENNHCVSADPYAPEKASNSTSRAKDSVPAPVDGEAVQARRYIRLGDGQIKWVLQREVAAILYQHQREGIRWLWHLHKRTTGGILGDDMGLGKTMTVSAFLAGLLVGGCISSAIVVAPATLLDQWAKELKQCECGHLVHKFHGQSKRDREREFYAVKNQGGILLTTYGMLTHNASLLCVDDTDADFCATDSSGSGTWSGVGCAGSAQRARASGGSLAFEWLIADEGHKLKNEKSQSARCIRCVRSERRLLLTGTPIQNNLRELWSLMDLCAPGLLGDKSTFKHEYEKPITRGQSREASERERHQSAQTSKALRKKIEPHFRRKEKEQILSRSNERSSTALSKTAVGDEECDDELSNVSSAQRSDHGKSSENSCSEDRTASKVQYQKEDDGRNIPPAPSPKGLGRKNDIVVHLKLTHEQRSVYSAFLNCPTVHSALNRAGSALSALTMLKKICDHPQLMSEKTMQELTSDGCSESSKTNIHQEEVDARQVLSKPSCSIRSCKIEFTLAMTKELIEKGHKLLMFSQSKEFLEVTEQTLHQHSIAYIRIDGDVPPEERQRRVDRFKQTSATEIPVFLLTSHVGGLGLTLTEASRIIVLDPSWNPATDNQSVDRAYRIGQDKDVVVYRLITCGTVEEKIYRKQVFKGALSRAGTDESEAFRYFTQEQLSDLFSASVAGFERSETHKQLNELHGAKRECSDAVAEELHNAESLDYVAGLTDHDVLFSRPDDTRSGTGTKDALAYASSSELPGTSSTSKRNDRAPSIVWSGSSSSVSGILTSRTQNSQKAKISLAGPSDIEHRNSNVSTEEGNAQPADQQQQSRQQLLQNELGRVQKTLASVKLDKLPDRGENLKRRQQALQEELHDANIGSAGESNERATDSQGAEALADQIGSMKL